MNRHPRSQFSALIEETGLDFEAWADEGKEIVQRFVYNTAWGEQPKEDYV